MSKFATRLGLEAGPYEGDAELPYTRRMNPYYWSLFGGTARRDAVGQGTDYDRSLTWNNVSLLDESEVSSLMADMEVVNDLNTVYEDESLVGLESLRNRLADSMRLILASNRLGSDVGIESWKTNIGNENFLAAIGNKIKDFFKWIWEKITGFFKWIFGKTEEVEETREREQTEAEKRYDELQEKIAQTYNNLFKKAEDLGQKPQKESTYEEILDGLSITSARLEENSKKKKELLSALKSSNMEAKEALGKVVKSKKAQDFTKDMKISSFQMSLLVPKGATSVNVLNSSVRTIVSELGSINKSVGRSFDRATHIIDDVLLDITNEALEKRDEMTPELYESLKGEVDDQLKQLAETITILGAGSKGNVVGKLKIPLVSNGGIAVSGGPLPTEVSVKVGLDSNPSSIGEFPVISTVDKEDKSIQESLSTLTRTNEELSATIEKMIKKTSEILTRSFGLSAKIYKEGDSDVLKDLSTLITKTLVRECMSAIEKLVRVARELSRINITVFSNVSGYLIQCSRMINQMSSLAKDAISNTTK